MPLCPQSVIGVIKTITRGPSTGGLIQVPQEVIPECHRGDKDNHKRTVYRGVIQVPQEVILEASEQRS